MLSSLAQNNRTHRIQTLLSLTKSSLFTTTHPPYVHHISVQPPRSTRSSSLVAIARPPCLWNQLPSSLRQSHSSLSVCPPCSCSYHIFSLCQLTTLTIHNSISLSPPAQDLSLSQIFPTHHIDSFQPQY